MPIIANTSSANTFSATRAQLNAVTKRLNQFAGNESTLYANTINANVSLRISGTDVRATFAQNTYVKSVLANTNSYIASRASWTGLTGTNTALRTLISDRLQVANASTLYATKASPTTSGLLAHTGRATISTNFAVSGNTTLSGLTTLRGYTGGTVGSSVASYGKSFVIGGTYNQTYNSGNSVLLLIADYSNDAGDNVYPIYVEDENNVVDFYLSAGSNGSGTDKKAYFGGSVGIGTTSPSGKLHVSAGRSYFAPSSEQYAIALKYNGSTSGVWLGSPGTDAFTVSTEAGTERMRITAEGNLGLGTNAPSNFGASFKTLQVTGTDYGVVQATGGAVTAELMASGAASVGFVGTRTNHPFILRTFDTERMRIHSGGEITVNGTTIGWASSGRGVLTINGTTSAILGFSVNGGSNGYVYNDGTSLFLNANPGPLIFQIAGNERMRIDTSGRLGIGTTPTSQFHVYGSDPTQIIESTNTGQYASARLRLRGPASSTRSTDFVHGNENAGGTNTYFAIEGTDVNYAYQKTMAIFYHASNYWSFNYYGVNGASWRAPIFYDSDDTNYFVNPNGYSSMNEMRLWGNNLYIRGGSPTIFFTDVDHMSAMLHNNSNILYILRGGVDSTGWATVGSGNWPMVVNLSNNDVTWGGNISAIYNVVAYASDKRLKENVVEIPNAIDKIKQIRGVTFDWKNEAEELGFVPETKYNDLGVIAQEIQAVLPQAVKPAPFDAWTPDPSISYEQEYLDKMMGTSKSGENYLTVQLEKLVPLLIEGIKEQQNQIDELRTELRTLRGTK